MDNADQTMSLENNSLEATQNKISKKIDNLKGARKNRRKQTPTRYVSTSSDLDCRFICKICGNISPNRHEFLLHKRTHTKPEFVEPSAKNETSKAHKTSCKGSKKYKCKECKKSFRSKYYLREHIKIHNVGHFACEVCGKVLPNPLALSRHKYIHKWAYKCTLCPKSFAKKESLELHKISHKKSYKCEECGLVFEDGIRLSNHSTLHKERPYRCEQCGRTFCLSKNWEKHISESRKNHKKLTCNVCVRSFCKEGLFKRHMLIHGSETPHKCDICGVKFRTKFSLNLHRLMHENRPCTCEICGQNFFEEILLKRHIQEHEQNKNDELTEISDLEFVKVEDMSNKPQSEESTSAPRGLLSHMKKGLVFAPVTLQRKNL